MFLNTVIGAINYANCSVSSATRAAAGVDHTMSPDGTCAALHREVCEATVHTCGVCLDGYFGESGDANTICTQVGSPLPANVPVGCPGGDCNGVGQCFFLDEYSGGLVETCFVGSSCRSGCSCDRGYTGTDCSFTIEELQKAQQFRGDIVGGFLAASASGFVDMDREEVLGQISGISSIASRSDELSPEVVADIFNFIAQTVRFYERPSPTLTDPNYPHLCVPCVLASFTFQIPPTTFSNRRHPLDCLYRL